MGTLKPQSSGPLDSNTTIAMLAVNGWLLYLVQRGAAWTVCCPAQAPPRYIRCNSHPSTASVPTSYLFFDVAL